MKMWPQKLDDWSLSAIEELLTKGCFESDGFDFKESLPHFKNQDDARRLLKTCCAFANSNGGFLIFGVRDDRAALVEDRLVGLDPTEDFPEHFGKFPQKCIPGVYWNFRNPPLTLPNGRIIHVIEIPGSWKKPHCFKMGDESLCFAKRTNQGNDVMSYSEISMNFLGFYEKRLKLQLLQAELENILEDAEEMKAPLGGTWYTINEFEMIVIESVLVDVYTILAAYPELIKLMARIRSICRKVNNKQRIFFDTMSRQPNAGMWPYPIEDERVKEHIKWHNDFMHTQSGHVIEYGTKALSMLKEILAM